MKAEAEEVEKKKWSCNELVQSIQEFETMQDGRKKGVDITNGEGTLTIAKIDEILKGLEQIAAELYN